MNVEYSFVVPTYNSERTIEKCLRSIKNQKVKGSELIVVDDSSTDRTIQIAKKYANETILKEKRSGPAKSRNMGWKKSKGKIIIFVDSDVYLGKGWKKEIFPLLKNYDGVISKLGYRSHNVSSQEWGEAANFFVIKKSILEKVKGYSEIFPYAMGEDSDLLIRILKKGYKIRNKKSNYLHDPSIKKYVEKNIFKKIYRTYFWILVCNLKNIDFPRCREFIFIKIPLKIIGKLEKYKELKRKKKMK